MKTTAWKAYDLYYWH